MKIRKGDTVKVIAGKDKGKTGSVLTIHTAANQVTVEGLNISKRHQKAKQRGTAGQIVEKSMPIDASNVALMEGDKTIRAGYEMQDGKKVRISRQSGKKI
jgi:large subunit ribosomal protein L24